MTVKKVEYSMNLGSNKIVMWPTSISCFASLPFTNLLTFWFLVRKCAVLNAAYVFDCTDTLSVHIKREVYFGLKDKSPRGFKKQKSEAQIFVHLNSNICSL